MARRAKRVTTLARATSGRAAKWDLIPRWQSAREQVSRNSLWITCNGIP